MDAFIKIFIAIDQDGSNEITFDELQNYCRKNNLDQKMVTKWRELFDPRNTGRITLDAFCDKLGLHPADIQSQRIQGVQAAPRSGLGSDITVISHHMSIEQQIAISNEARRIASSIRSQDESEIARLLCEYCERAYGPSWHVVLSKGPYWVRCRHLPNESFHFRMHETCYSVWRTPGELVRQ